AEGTAARGYGAEVEGEPLHLRLGQQRPHDLPVAVRLRARDLAALGVEVRHDVPQVALRHPDLDLHDGFQQHRVGLHCRLSNGERAGDLEGYVGRVNGVVLAVHQADLDVHHRIAGDHTLGHATAAPPRQGGPEVLRDGPAEDFVLPDKALAPGRGVDLDDTDAVLSVSP